jgi:pimeloyl-ACP methyl ester carboxylesterase
VLLPGMDGTGELSAPYLGVDPAALPIGYPRDQALGYDELERWLRPRLPEEPFVVVAESFSGPLGVRLAADPPPGMRGLVLVATFVLNPSPIPSAFPVLDLLFRVPPPRWVVGRYLVGEPALAEAVCRAIATVRPAVMAHRARQILTLDAREPLGRCQVPALYLRAARDRLVGERSAREIAALVPSCRQHVLDTPHLLLQSAPAQAAARIQEFVQAVTGGR